MGRHWIFQLQKVSQSSRVLGQGRGQAYVTWKIDPLRAGAQRRHLRAPGRWERSPADQTPWPLCTCYHQPMSSTCCRCGSTEAQGRETTSRRDCGFPPALGGQPSLAGATNPAAACAQQVPRESRTACLLRPSDRTGRELQLLVLQFFWRKKNHSTEGYEIYFDNPAAMARISVVPWRAQVGVSPGTRVPANLQHGILHQKGE